MMKSHGKSLVMKKAIDQAISAGKRVAICGWNQVEMREKIGGLVASTFIPSGDLLGMLRPLDCLRFSMPLPVLDPNNHGLIIHCDRTDAEWTRKAFLSMGVKIASSSIP